MSRLHGEEAYQHGMITVGIDLASDSDPGRTAVCRIRWTRGRAEILSAECCTRAQRCDRDFVRRLATDADHVGIDVPLGWPDAFVKALDDHRRGQSWATTGTDDLSLRLRRTDHHTAKYVKEQTGKSCNPLSVSSSWIAIPAMQASRLLSGLGSDLDRSGQSGKIVEVYPKAALMLWFCTSTESPGEPRQAFAIERYKDDGETGHEVRSKIVDHLVEMSGGRLVVADDVRKNCQTKDDPLDALIAALVARANAVRQCADIPPDVDQAQARSEGWIALPKPGTFHRLFEV
jgi:hypothetical protein